ncbi:MAG: enoyl-CoA hydratase/isomerase family protein [Rubrivivax sp.]|nr:enoyl-CoA hydratase/isomerase family protein [Rubrivivax sp.]
MGTLCRCVAATLAEPQGLSWRGHFPSRVGAGLTLFGPAPGSTQNLPTDRLKNNPAPETSLAEPTVLIETRGPVRLISLNRPATLNAFTGEMIGELLPALDAVAADDTIRALIVSGVGRGFSAGQDLNAPGARPGEAAAPDLQAIIERMWAPLAARIRSLPVPVIAAVNGVAAGAGANFALNCDIVLAARGASFIQAFSKIGLIPDAGGTWLLPRLVGRAHAMALALTGDKLPAEEAARIGLIWRCVDDAALMDEAWTLARRLAAMPTRALVETRQAIDRSMLLDNAQAVQMEAEVQGRLGRQHDFTEGVQAFLAKRPPVFTDR